MKLLLIMPNFFDYPDIIKVALTEKGYDVDFFDDRPSTKGWVKAVIRVNKRLIQKSIRSYFDIIMKTIKNRKYDVVFFISGQSLSFDENMVWEIKKSQPQARFILYQWDSLKNFPYIVRMHKFFDKCYSFDRKDVRENKNLIFLPLFYCKRYEQIGKQKQENLKYDFCFVGTAHPQKYKFIKRISEQLKDVFPRQYIYFFFPSVIVFVYRKIVNRELRKAHYKEFHFTPLTGDEISDLYLNSRCVLDSSQAGQEGLTMRTLEAVGAKKKLITTNRDIVNYDFYREENIYIYENKIDMSSPFFTRPYVDIDNVIYKKYSLDSWLNELLG